MFSSVKEGSKIIYCIFLLNDKGRFFSEVITEWYFDSVELASEVATYQSLLQSEQVMRFSNCSMPFLYGKLLMILL